MQPNAKLLTTPTLKRIKREKRGNRLRNDMTCVMVYLKMSPLKSLILHQNAWPNECFAVDEHISFLSHCIQMSTREISITSNNKRFVLEWMERAQYGFDSIPILSVVVWCTYDVCVCVLACIVRCTRIWMCVFELLLRQTHPLININYESTQ